MSLNRESPSRLKEQESGLQQLSERSFSKERLEQNRAAVERAIESLPPAGASAPVPTIVAITLGTALVTAVAWFALTEQPMQNPQPLVEKIERQSPQAQSSNAPRQTTNTASLEAPSELPAVTSQIGAADATASPAPSQEEGKFKHMQKAPLRIKPTQPSSKAKEPKIRQQATLGRELELFRKAKNHFDNRDYALADKALSELAKTFPEHQLGVELSLLKIRTQLAQGESETAFELMQELMSQPPTKPQAQWYKLLGEIQQIRGRCGPALIAYSKALKMGLGSRQEHEVRQAVRRCSQD